jgi:cytoskeletal protein CcmA (bactofilin family)
MTDCWHRASIAALIALCNGLLVAPAHAAGSDDSTVIIDTDRSVVLAGGSVNPSKPVPENLIAAGGRVIVDQPVGRSAILAGGSVGVRAPIEKNLRVAAGSISIEGPVGGSLAAAGGEVHIARGGAIGNGARVFGGTITVDGHIDGPLKASAERIIINGDVTGDVKLAGEEIVLGPGARIGGSLRYASAKELVKGEGASIGGEVTRNEPGTKGADEDVPHVVSRGASIAGTVISFLALLGCGALFLAAAPIFTVETPDRIRSTPWKALGVGLLTVIGVPILAILFMLTIIGIPIGVMLLMLYPIALLFGFLVGTLFVGNAGASLLKRPPPPTIAAAVGYFAIALAVVMLVARTPSVGGLLLAVLILLGVGAFLVELYRRMKGGSRVRVSSATA